MVDGVEKAAVQGEDLKILRTPDRSRMFMVTTAWAQGGLKAVESMERKSIGSSGWSPVFALSPYGKSLSYAAANGRVLSLRTVDLKD
jgi:hypothetical protein